MRPSFVTCDPDARSPRPGYWIQDAGMIDAHVYRAVRHGDYEPLARGRCSVEVSGKSQMIVLEMMG